MSRIKTSLDHKRIRRLIWLVLTVSVLLSYSLQSVAGSVYYSMVTQAYGTVGSPPVILEEGNVSGASTIYTNKTSAKVNVTAPLFDYVDNDDSDVDSSEDKGTHSNFTAQQYGPDSIYDTLTEQDTTVMSVALIVGNPGSPSATQDVPFYDHINARAGWTATYLAASPLPDVSGYDLVEITYSVDTSPDFSSWKTLAKPIFIHDRRHADDIALTTTEGDYRTSQTTINITDNTHYITSPYSLGNLAIASSTYFSYAGTIAGDVDALATISGYSTDWALLEIDTGETLSDGVTSAPARRVYYPPAQYDATTLNPDGWAIFDRVMDWLEPAHVGDKEEYVDIISDVDYSPDKGTHSNFTAQQYGPDSIYDTLTEENVGVYSNSTLLDDGFEAVDWDANWDDIAHNWQEDNSIVHSGSASAWAADGYEGYFTCDNLNASDANAIYIDFWFMKDDIEDTDFTLYYYNGSNYNLIDELDNNGGDDTWLHYTEKVTDSQYFVSNFRIRFDATLADTIFDENVWVDDVLIKKEIQTDDNYELDLEVRWTNLHFGFPNEELCIYANTTDTEDIKVDVWNTTTSSWDSLLSDLNASSWNNVSITDWLTSTNFTIRFNGGNETGDTTQNSWQIDVCLIHVWTYYVIDLEVQWANADYDEENEELCIYSGDMDSENIQVDVWNGSEWITLITDLNGTSWNNVSISSYLTSSNFTIRFKGGSETGDTSPDSWDIDATLLHVWTSNGTYDYVLKVVNQVADNWTVNLQVYDSSNIDRLSSLNISLHDGTSSNQIAVSGGSIVKSEGEPYNLPGGVNSTIYISMSNLQATTTGTSYIYTYLKIQKPNTTTYMLYVITFEIT